jgi:hypothetical protein
MKGWKWVEEFRDRKVGGGSVAQILPHKKACPSKASFDGQAQRTAADAYATRASGHTTSASRISTTKPLSGE